MTDQPPTNHIDHGESGTDQPPTTPDMVPLKDAAAILGISVNAVRQRLKRGTLEGVKTDAGWLVNPTPTNHRPTTPETTSNQPPTTPATTDQPPTDHSNKAREIDLSPLVDELRDLRKENAQLHSMAAWLVSQNAHLERQLEELRTIDATENPAVNTPGSPESASSSADDVGHGQGQDSASGGTWGRLWRWLRGS